MEGEEDAQEMGNFFDDLFKQGFGGDVFIDDFEEFMDILEGGNDKAFRAMFRDLGRNYRKKTGRCRKPVGAKANKDFVKMKRGMRKLDKEMMMDMDLSLIHI